jgi:putative two-component system response regulator
MASSNPSVLLVEDDPPTRTLYQRALSAHYHVFACAEHDAALDVVRSHQIDAVVLEPACLGQRGWALLDTLKQVPSTQFIPIILCSTLDERKRGMQAGAAVYLVKPVVPSTLLGILAQFMMS